MDQSQNATPAAAQQAAHDILVSPGARLGFGTAHLRGGRSHSQSVRLIEAALDHGITYFDTARLYADGAAEHVLGEVLVNKRGDIHIASKVGILPARNSKARRGLNKALNMARGKFGLAGLLPEPRWAEPEFGAFGRAAMQASIETSLRALKTDYLDVLWLHECSAADVQSPIVQDFLSDMMWEGKIRTWGVAATAPATHTIIASDRDRIPAFQMSYDAWLNRRDAANTEMVRRVSLHSVFATILDAVASSAITNPETARALSNLEIDPADRQKLATHLLAAALLDVGPGGLVLFSTSKPERIAAAHLAHHVTPDGASQMQNIMRLALSNAGQPIPTDA